MEDILWGLKPWITLCSLKGKYSPQNNSMKCAIRQFLWFGQHTATKQVINFRDSVVLTIESSRFGAGDALREVEGCAKHLLTPQCTWYWQEMPHQSNLDKHVTTCSHWELWITCTKGADSVCFSNILVTQVTWRLSSIKYMWHPSSVDES